MEIIKVNDTIVPRRIIYNNKLYEIIRIHDSSLIIRGYTIYLNNGNLNGVTISGKHPNCDNSGNFCLPRNMREIPFSDQIFSTIKTLLLTYNLNDCYFSPWSGVDYKEMKK